MLEKLFEPIKIGNVVIKNRLHVPPMVANFCTPAGFVTDKFINYHEAKAKGGWGLITIEQSVVCKSGKGHPGQPALWSDEYIEGLKKLTDKIHESGAKVSVQINHAGRQTVKMICGQQPVAPSAIKDPFFPEEPKELTIDEIQTIVEQFGDAALRAKKAGFDMIEEHAHAGYLIATFLSSMSNKRTDEYGGCFYNRARFALEILDNMRKKVGPDFPIMVRFSADEFVQGGLTINDMLAFARLLESHGANALDVSVGNCNSFQYMVQSMAVPHGFIAGLAEEIKKAVNIPVTVAGRINDPFIAEAIIASGKSDMVSMGRASIADPELPNKLKDGRFDEIRYCVGCLQGCTGKVGQYQPMTCMVNPEIGFENSMTKADKKKKIMVIGAGIGGAEAAITAATRGHDVSLYEKSDRIGGQWLIATVPPTKTEFASYTAWQSSQLKKLGVKTVFNKEVDVEMIKSENPDAVIIATGGIPVLPKIKGIDSKNVTQAFDVLKSLNNLGNEIVVVGGGLVGAEVAEHLAVHGKKVTIIEMMDQIAKEGEMFVNCFLLDNLNKHNVGIITSATVTEITDDSISYEKNGSTITINNVDNIVIAVGVKSFDNLSSKLDGIAEKVIVLGDAKKIGKAIDAINEGYAVGLTI